MDTPFVIRVQSDDRVLSHEIAQILTRRLSERVESVALADDAPGTEAARRDAPRVVVETRRRHLPGTTVVVGLPEAGAAAPRWLAPLPVAENANAASTQVVTFLEQWGFIAAHARSRLPAS